MHNIFNKIEQSGKHQYWIFFSILVLLTLFTMWCNGPSSSYSGFDFFFHFRRLDVLIDALRHGSYPVYIDYANAEGYGYFIKGFYPDLILVPFAFIGIFTSTYFAYDVMVFAMTVLCGVLMYHTVRVIFKSRYAAAVSSLLYTFAVYRLYDFYQRGALSEGLSFTFLPIIFLGLYYIVKGDYRKWYVLAIGYSLLIYTHVIASVLMFVTLLILIIIYCKSLIREPKGIAYLVLAGVVTVIITSYYIFPTLEQLGSNSFYLDARTPGGGAGYGKVDFDILLWGFVSGIAYPKILWTGVGIILTVLIFLRFFVKGHKTDRLRAVDIGVVIGILFIIATSRIFPWGRFPFNILSFIQYPWRLYEFVTFFFAIAGGYYLSLLLIKNRQRMAAFAVIVVATLITTYIHSENFKILFPKNIEGNVATSEQPAFGNRYHTIGGEYFPARLPNIEYIRDRGEIAETGNEDTKVTDLKRERNVTSLHISVNSPDTVILPLIYYYGYVVTLNGEKVYFEESDNGLIAVPVDRSGEIKVWYAGTTMQKVSFYISMIAILALIVFIIWEKNKSKDGENRTSFKQNSC